MDCDFNGILDSCELASNPSLDCDQSGTLDSCDVENGTLKDCNQNQIGDSCEIAVTRVLMPITMESLTLVNALQTSIKMGLLTGNRHCRLLSCWEQEVNGVWVLARCRVNNDAIGFGDLLLILSGFGPC